MADVNVNAPAEQTPAMAPPTRTDDQILPRSSWVPVGKKQLLFGCRKVLEQSNLQDFCGHSKVHQLLQSLHCFLDNSINLYSAILGHCLIWFERPRASVLHILWDIVNRAHIDYAERMWEEFTQSIRSFIEDKKNLALHTYGKKKANPLVIPSVRFTNLIIHHLQSKHQGLILHFIFLLKSGQYYNEYLEKVAKHQRYLAGEEGSDPDSPVPKPAKATKPKANKKSKHSAPKAAPVIKPTAAKASKSTSSQQPKPKHAPIMPQEKKRKLIKETSDKPSPAKRSKRGLVTKRRKSTSLLRLVDEFVDKGVPENEPRFDDEEANLQRVVAESLKDVLPTHRGPLSPVVFREPDSGRRQPLPEVQGKGKEKVIEEQVAHTLIDLNTPKKKSTTDQCIFQRRTLKTAKPTGPSTHHEDEKVTFADVETNTEELLAHTEKSGEEVSNTMVLGTESGRHDEKQGGPDPGNSDEYRPLPSQGIYTGSRLDLMDKGFIATAYPSVQENLKLTIEEQVILEEPAKNEKTTAETKAESMVSVTIQQDTSTIPHMTTPVIDLTSKPNSPKTPPGSPPHQPPPPPPPACPFGTFGSSRASGLSQVPPPPPPPRSTNQEGQSDGFIASSSSKTAASAEYTAWTTSDTRFRPSASSILEDLHMDDDSAPNKHVHSSDDEDTGNDHIPKVKENQEKDKNQIKIRQKREACRS
uniref:Uncharacterized protein n=1 Tax=Tanacetum cinerariifolium TaxID=118510 RepID=A0A699H9R4_TANCI|nr:hypothetical protein [Tanacetum cinerariifolium]